MLIFTSCIFIILTLIVKILSNKRNRSLPGPKQWPILGNVLQINQRKPHLTMSKWAETFGEVYLIKLWGEDFVVLNSYETIYEALVKKANDFAGRPPSFRIDFLIGGGHDVTFTTFSRHWLFMKKLTMQTLKMYGDNLASLERLSLGQISDMLEAINEASQDEETFNIRPIIHHCVTCIMTSLVFGEKTPKEKVKYLDRLTSDRQRIVQPTGIYFLLDMIPWLRHLPIKIFHQIYSNRDEVFEWFNSTFYERKKLLIPNNPQCFMDGLCDRQRQFEEKHTELTLPDEDLLGILRDMIFPGTVTTTITITALIAVLVNREDIQQCIANEIAAVLDKRPPSLQDRASMPYTEAVILEILRYSSILPLNLPHYTMFDTSVNEFTIPKDTRVLCNLWNLHHSKKYWEEPWEFIPQRFLDNDGNLVPSDHINRKRLLPFGASRRVCPGESLAKNRLFLMVVSLIQQFRFDPESPERLPPSDPRSYEADLLITIPAYKIRITHRK